MCFFKSRIRNDSRIPEGSRRDRDYDALIRILHNFRNVCNNFANLKKMNISSKQGVGI